MTQHEWDRFADQEDIDDPAKLPTNHKVTAAQVTMQPDQSLDKKAKELGCSRLTLRIWTAEWRGSG